MCVLGGDTHTHILYTHTGVGQRLMSLSERWRAKMWKSGKKLKGANDEHERGGLCSGLGGGIG